MSRDEFSQSLDAIREGCEIPRNDPVVLHGPYFLAGSVLISLSVILVGWWVTRTIYRCRRPAQPPQGTVGQPYCR